MPNQVHSAICAITSKGHFKHNSGRQIHVQKTARSRRWEGLSKGAKPVPQGRPKSVLKGVATHSGIGPLPNSVQRKWAKKRLRYLGEENIWLIHANEKPHGNGH